MRHWNKARYGYTDLADVTADPSARPTIAGLWAVRQMNILSAVSDTPRFDYTSTYLSTEGNMLLGLVRPRG